MVKSPKAFNKKNSSVNTLKESLDNPSSRTKVDALPETTRKRIEKTKSNNIFIKAFKIIGYIIFFPYLRNSWKELKQVNWPNFKLSRQLTVAVIIFAVFFGAAIALADFGLGKIFKVILLK